MRNNKQPKIFYATQIGVYPPTIVLFTNGPDLFDETYIRYLTKTLRDAFPFSEVAIKFSSALAGRAGPKREDDTTEEMAALRKLTRMRRPSSASRVASFRPARRRIDRRRESREGENPAAETWDF